jgi:hypothetical protein
MGMPEMEFHFQNRYETGARHGMQGSRKVSQKETEVAFTED